jgi:hypothetical protein
MAQTYWNGILTRRLNRRRALAATGATALGAAFLAACGGTDGGTSFQSAADAQEPGKVWFAANDWKLADETKQAVRGGIYRAVPDEQPDALRRAHPGAAYGTQPRSRH